MSTNPNPHDELAKKEKRIDDLAAALEEAEEQNEESRVVEDANANLKEHPNLTDRS